ncbi:hypothetical protein JR316_0004194 [Psilocybe cubensis]|uniref:Uncharacterized protein n=2 Tax=Psilocybe cubensis TaxID=181762 RepID=A0ACB8H311_PSICU|nr:hypothetical protein JR316_0004194 [Psilocybe cubensis]KAH9482099.1 hypothetical protein JR316_0004194 [Psilocybe cubensis]
MTFVRSLIFSLSTAFFLCHLVFAQNYTAGPGPCHPYPGADPHDCLALISENLDDDHTVVSCINNRATITKGACSIVTTCNSTSTGEPNSPEDVVIPYDAVRRALVAIGSCALKEYGSISGYYITEQGVKTCYLYPGRESYCRL